MIKIFDSHAHYSDSVYDEDRDLVFKKMYDAGVDRVTLIGASLSNSIEEKDIAILYNKKNNMPHFYYVIGDHPDELPKYLPDSSEGVEHLVKIENLCKNDENKLEAVAIGEIGLDYYGDHKTEKDIINQKKWFVVEMDLARKLNLPVVIHSRDACQDTLNFIKDYGKGLRGIIHCFSYEKEIANEYIKLGFHIGIGGVVTFKNARKIKEVVLDIPIESIVSETDAPWLSPMPYRGKRNDSSNIKYVLEEIANIKNMDLELVAKTLYNNSMDVYNVK